MKKLVDAISIIVLKDDLLLVEKRRMDKETDPGLIVIPGGHVEKDETFTEACKRELKEELGLECDSFRYVASKPWTTPIEDLMVHYYVCEDWVGVPRCYEAEKIFFIGREELHLLDADIDREVFVQLFP